MTGVERREKLLSMLAKSKEPIAGAEMAKRLSVSRQVIVQDIALLRAADNNIVSTNRGYVLLKPGKCERIFKVRHTAEEYTYFLSSTNISSLHWSVCSICLCISHCIYLLLYLNGKSSSIPSGILIKPSALAFAGEGLPAG